MSDPAKLLELPETIPCSSCLVLTLTDCMRSVADIAWPLNLVCDGCHAECVHAYHERLEDDYEGPCKCAECRAFENAVEARRRREDAASNGGLSVRGLMLVFGRKEDV